MHKIPLQEYSVNFQNTPTADTCHKFCGKNDDCNWWSWEPEQTLCVVFANCTDSPSGEPDIGQCPTCISGQRMWGSAYFKRVFIVTHYVIPKTGVHPVTATVQSSARATLWNLTRWLVSRTASGPAETTWTASGTPWRGPLTTVCFTVIVTIHSSATTVPAAQSPAQEGSFMGSDISMLSLKPPIQ